MKQHKYLNSIRLLQDGDNNTSLDCNHDTHTKVVFFFFLTQEMTNDF
jgi:hypothetical protein